MSKKKKERAATRRRCTIALRIIAACTQRFNKQLLAPVTKYTDIVKAASIFDYRAKRAALFALAKNYERAAQYYYTQFNKPVLIELTQLAHVHDEMCKKLDKQLDTEQLIKPIPDIRVVMRDLEALESLFGGYKLSFIAQPPQPVLTVPTHNIELSDAKTNYDLGCFNIQLNLQKMAMNLTGEECAYISPVDSSITTDSTVPHPHVRSNMLCAGDAKLPLTSALDYGLITDWFSIVLNTLQTYNPESAYRPLRELFVDKDMAICEDCGERFDIDDGGGSCVWCNRSLCDSCLLWCESAQETVCQSCSNEHICCSEPGSEGCAGGENKPCFLCNEIVCDGELYTCDVINRKICVECLDYAKKQQERPFVIICAACAECTSFGIGAAVDATSCRD